MANLVSCTVDPGGTGDYTSLANAESDYFGAGTANLVTADKYIVCTCICTNGAADGGCTIDGLTTDATRNLTIAVDSTYRHSGTFPSGNKFRIVKTTNGYPLQIADHYVSVVGLAISAEYNGGGQSGIYLNYVGGVVIAYCVIRRLNIAGSSNYGVQMLSDSTIKIFNCVIYGFLRGYYDGSSSQAYSEVYNNTFVGCTYGMYVPESANYRPKLKNNIFYNCGTAARGNYAAGSGYNATDNESMYYTVSGGATSDRVSQTFSFVDAGANNYALTSSDSGAKDYGVSDPSGSGLFSDDIVGNSRTAPWDIGAFEYLASGGGAFKSYWVPRYVQSIGGGLR